MKKAILPIVVSVLVLATTILWILKSGTINWTEILQFLIIIAVVGFGFFASYRRLSSQKRGEPLEDEYSKKVVQKASSISYFISLYLWLFIMYLTDKLKVKADIMFGWGILGMAVVFVVSWLFYHFRGIKDA